MNSILLVDDHQMIRDAIKAYFDNSEDYIISGEVKNGIEALNKLKESDYDLVLTDISMPEMDGLELMSEIRAQYPDQKVLVLSMFNDKLKIKKMIELGANGYILKNASKSEVVKAISTILNGENYYSKEVYETLIDSIAKRNPKERLTLETPLSNREKEVLILIANELTNQEIADKLFISSRTVETHKRNLLDKTGCKNVAGLVMYAVEKEII
ncbi:MAG: response regulator transcription factor [Cyclobacteriaceae bacterium]